MKINFFIFFSVITITVFSQDEGYVRQMITKELTDKVQKKSNRTLSKNEIENIYLFKDWKNDAFVYTTNKKIKLNNINYSVLDKKFDTRMSKDSIYMFDSNTIDSVEVNKRKFIKKYYNNENFFFESIAKTDKTKLLKKYYLRVKKGKLDNITGKTSKDSYVKMHKYFLIESNNFIDVKLNKKMFQKYFSKHYKNLLNYSKENKLSFKKEKDVVTIINYYNSL